MTKRTGFILVVTLVMIAFAGILLTGLCRHSLAMSLAVHETSERLQERWGMASCQRVAFSLADEVLSETRIRDDGSSEVKSLPTASLGVNLGGLDFDLLLADDQAKVNVNLLDANLDREQTARTLEGLVNGVDADVQLRPLVGTSVGTDGLAYKRWEQVFSPGRLRLTEYPDQLVVASRHVTCWSAGSRLHLWAASDAAISCVAGLVLSPIEVDRLIAQRRASASGNLAELLDELDLSRRKRTMLERLLVDACGSVSVWIRIHKEGQRSAAFCVRMTESDVTRTYVTTW